MSGLILWFVFTGHKEVDLPFLSFSNWFYGTQQGCAVKCLMAQAPLGSLQELEWGEGTEGRAQSQGSVLPKIIQQPQAKPPLRSVTFPSHFPESRWWKSWEWTTLQCPAPLLWQPPEGSRCTGQWQCPGITEQTGCEEMCHWMPCTKESDFLLAINFIV